MLQKWLCVDGNCIYAEKNILEVSRVPYPRAAYSIKTKEMFVFCKIRQRYVRRWVKECKHYQNTTLEGFK